MNSSASCHNTANNTTDNTELVADEQYSVNITGYTHKGLGVARIGKEVIFIPGALCDEKLKIRTVARHKGIWQAEITDILHASPERITPQCPVYHTCGGCEVQHMTYAEECNFKTRQVMAALQRVGGLDIDELTASGKMRPIIAAKEQYHYRNTGIFHVVYDKVQGSANGNNNTQLTFWGESSHQAAGQCCKLLFPEVLNQITDWLTQQTIPESVSDIMLRCSHNQKSVMLICHLAFDKTDTPKQKQKKSTKSIKADIKAPSAVIELLRKAAERFPVIRVWGVQVGHSCRIYSEEERITTDLFDVSYQLSPTSFFQVNYDQTEQMLNTIKNTFSGQEDVLLDAYCGIGTLGICMANQLPGIKQLVGAEINPAAVDNARLNAVNNGILNAHFYSGKAEERFAEILTKHNKVDAVIIDPPRAGCHKKLLQGLLELAAPKIIYVSCNPATLARDLQLLCADMYTIELIQPIDMFPRTHHVETVVQLVRKA